MRGELALGRRAAAHGAAAVVASYNAPIGFARTVATVVHDVSYLRLPETFPAALRLRIRASVARSVRVSDLVVTVSEFSRHELLDCYPRLAPADVVVVPNAADPLFSHPVREAELLELRRRYALPERFVLALGNVQPRKNLERLSRACLELGVPLVVAGQVGWRADAVLSALRAAGARLLGHVPRADLPRLLRACDAFAYPSLYEGFGLPVVEAMAAGAPVVCSGTTAVAEVAGDAAVLVDPLSVGSIRDGLRLVLTDPEVGRQLRRGGPPRASAYSWDASARVLAAALREAAA